VGGDYYDFFIIDEKYIGFTIGDVMGKGIPAALFSAIIRSTMRMAIMDLHSPRGALERANNVVYHDLTHSDSFISLFCGVLDTETGSLRFSNAAHNAPILIRQDNVQRLDTEGLLIGAKMDGEYEESEIQLLPDDTLVLFTDGVSETQNAKSERYGEDRLIEVIRNNRFQNSQLILDSVVTELAEFRGREAQFDDMTLVVGKVKKT
jgi:sigma-B regulation protein RsbU (phosphoserine phosphatase)